MRRVTWTILTCLTLAAAAPTARGGLDCSTLGVEWTWAAPYGREVRVTPVVAQNGVCGPAIIAVTYGTTPCSGTTPYRVALIDATGTTIDADLGRPVWPESVAFADVIPNGPGVPEVLAVECEGSRLVCWTVDGVEQWIGPDTFSSPGNGGGFALGVADFNCDGIPEVHVGSQVFTTDPVDPGKSLFGGAAGRGLPDFEGHPVSHAVDLIPGDDCLELLAGNTLYRPVACGGPPVGVIWDASVAGVPDGYTAVGDFVGDDGPEIMLIGTQLFLGAPAAWLLAPTDGQVLGTASWAGTNGNGASLPLAANLSAGGKAEWAFAQVGGSSGSGSTFTLLRSGGWVMNFGTASLVELLAVPIEDGSGNSAPTAFDFDADGIHELVHADERQFLIVQAGNPTPLVSLSRGVHGTRVEHPVVVDLDGDANAEILLVHGTSDPACPPPLHADVPGVSVYECDGSDTPRPVWNQYAYHVDNTTESAEIPCELDAKPWTTHGTWLAQVGCRIDFEHGELADGTVVSDQFLQADGITIESAHDVVILNTAVSPACDPDLVTCGYGSGNDVPRERVLILQEDPGCGYGPDDDGDGGDLTVKFATPRKLAGVGLLDIDDFVATTISVTVEGLYGPVVIPVPSLDDNSWQRVDIDLECVTEFTIHLGGSGALTNVFCGPLDSDLRTNGECP